MIAITILPFLIATFFLFSAQRRADEADRGVARTLQMQSLLDRTSILIKTEAGAPMPVDLIARRNEAMARLRADLAEMQAAEDVVLAARRAESRNAHRRALVTWIVASLGLAAGVITALFLMGTVASRITAATENATRLAAGEAMQPMTVSRDEVGSLSDALTRTFGLLQSRDQELRRRVADLAAANTELEAFSYSVSHDLRAPLRHIAGFAALLEKRAGDRLDDESNRYLHTITGAAARMGRLVDDLLAFSRMARADMSCKDVNMNDVVRDVVQEATQQTARRAIDWSTHPLSPVKGDPTMLRLALSNLVSNAVKYTSTREQAKIEIGEQPSANGQRVLYVRDNGVGFDMAYAHKLFGVFQRLHGADEFEGTGIGLANVRRIAQRHGGRTWAEAELDKGATFYMSLPVK